MSLDQFVIILLIAAVAAFLQFITGFGYAIIMVALLPFVIPLDTAVVLTIFVAGLQSAYMIWDCRGEFELRPLILPALFCMLGSLGGLFLSGLAAPTVYLRILGGLLLLLSIWFLAFSEKARLSATPFSAATAGAISGACGALFAISGPPMVLYYNSVFSDKRAYMGSLQCVMIVQGLVSLPGRAIMGIWPTGVWICLIPCLIGTIIGAIPGKYVFRRTDGAKLKKAIYLFMIAVGIYFIVK